MLLALSDICLFGVKMFKTRRIVGYIGIDQNVRHFLLFCQPVTVCMNWG